MVIYENLQIYRHFTTVYNTPRNNQINLQKLTEKMKKKLTITIISKKIKHTLRDKM